MQRRTFIRTAAAGTTVAAMFPNIILAKKHKKYKIALIGSGWWGMNILTTAIAAGQNHVVALCDVDQIQLNNAAAEVEKLTGKKPKKYNYYGDLLKKERPDIVIVGTPDHWHALPAIDALKAGAHVYLEKPIGHTIDEGKALVAAQKKYGKLIQVGLHRHIGPHNVAGMEFIKSGKVGEIKNVRAFVISNTRTPRVVTESNPPDTLDWDLWCGPAPLCQYNNHIHPKGFRSYLDYANGTCGDWGVHWFDQILWWTEDKHPKTVFSSGGKMFEDVLYDAPDYQVAQFEFESFTATWEHRRYGGNRNEKHPLGVYFYGTKGVFHMGWIDGWTFYPNDKNAEEVHMDNTLHQPDGQNIPELWTDFMNAIENNVQPIAGIEQSHYATNMSLLAMISYRTGRCVRWDGDQQMILNDPVAVELMSREYRAPWVYPTLDNI